MRFVIEKGPDGVMLSFAPDTTKKPIVVTLTLDQAEALIQLMRTAIHAPKFRIEWQP